jgi:malonyl-CoA/methylmalonyl-CoA synthetase
MSDASGPSAVDESNLYEALASRFRARAQAPWLILPDGSSISYDDLDAATARVVHTLRSLGVRRGDRVAAQVEKSPTTLVTYLGVLRAGAVFLPLNSAYRADEVEYFLSDAEPTVAIGRPEDGAWFPAAAVKVGVAHRFELDASGMTGSWADLIAAAPTDDPGVAGTQADDLAALVYTSGTTGRSKGAMISHRNVTSNAVALQQLWGFDEHDVLIHALPTFHVHGLFVALHTAMLTGIPMRFHQSFDPAAVIADFDRSTVFMGVPTMYVRLLSRPELAPETCSKMRLFVSGSAPLLPETFDAFREASGHTILERYGMTETGMNTSNPYVGARKGGTVGVPLPGVAVRVAAEGDRPLGVAEIGDVQVKGPNVLQGYWRRPDKNAEEFTADGWFRTGDVGQFDSDGYLELVGRSKDLVISGGYNVYPKEIELLLDEVPGVIESAVIGVAHPDFGEGVTAVLTVRPEPAIDTAALISDLKTRLASYKVPKSIQIVEELPRNAMGKVQKNLLRDRFANLYR